MPGVDVVGVGASAGGLEALTHLFGAMPSDTGCAFVVVQHLSPDFKSLLGELLGRQTTLRVDAVKEGQIPQSDVVYLCPPAHFVTLENGRLTLEEYERGTPLNFPVDRFLASLARDRVGRAVAIVLSGTGSDGSRGVVEVKNAGGLVIVQSPDSAGFDGMPRASLATGVTDLTLGPNEIPTSLVEWLDHNIIAKGEALGEVLDREGEHIRAILAAVVRVTGHDFSRYRMKPILRRILRRMQALDLSSPADYLSHLSEDEEEANRLHADLLINVTTFFRDKEAFEILEREVLTSLARDLPDDRTLRVWVAGSATGQEVYSVAMLLDELLRDESDTRRWRIFATDVDQEALARASAGVYRLEDLDGITPDRIARHFDVNHGEATIKPRLRHQVVFAPHDLTTDPPFTRIDLTICRNVLIYFEPDLQQTALSHLHFALRLGGFLFLGPSESLGALSAHFTVQHARWKFFRKQRDAPSMRPRLDQLRPPRSSEAKPAIPAETQGARRERILELEGLMTAAARLGGQCLLALDHHRNLLHVFGQGDGLLQVAPGRATLNILAMVHLDLRDPLATCLRRVDQSENAEYRTLFALDEKPYELAVQYLVGPSFRRPLFLCMITPAQQQVLTAATKPGEEERPDQATAMRILRLEEEISGLQAELHDTLEDANTTSEELQAANEELLASNEELQGTNEELQSVNEELHTINAEHQQKIKELAKLTDDMENLLKSTAIGTIFLDTELRIRRFTPSVAPLVPLMLKDAGRPLSHMSPRLIGVDLSRLAESALLEGESHEERVATTEGGSWLMRVHPHRDSDGLITGAVVTFVDLGALDRAESALARREAELDILASAIPEGVMLTDRDGKVVHFASSRLATILGHDIDAVQSRVDAWIEWVHPNDRERVRRLRGPGSFLREDEIGYRVITAEGEVRHISDSRVAVHDPGGKVSRLATLWRDVTRDRALQEELRDLQQALDHERHRDGTTGLLNRRGLDRRLAGAEAEELSRMSAIGVHVRDAGAGNTTAHLRTVAYQAQAVLRPDDELGRSGETRLLALLPGTSLQEARSVAQRMALSLSLPEGLTPELGVAALVDGPRSVSALEAELAAVGKQASRSSQLGDDELRPAFLPIHDLADGSVVAHRVIAVGAHQEALEGDTEARSIRERRAHALASGRIAELEIALIEAAGSRPQPPSERIHLPLDPQTLGAAHVDELLASLDPLLERNTVIIELDLPSLPADVSPLLRSLEVARARGVALGLRGLSLPRAGLSALIWLAPEHLILHARALEAASKDNDQEHALHRLARAAQALGASLSAFGLENEHLERLARDGGIREASGSILEERRHASE